MVALRDRVQERVDREVEASGFGGSFEVSETQTPNNLAAITDLRSKATTLEYNLRYVERHGEGKLLSFGTDASRHEINHHGYADCVGCPQTPDKDYENFFVPAFGVLTDKGFSETDVNYATNALEDTILHRDLRENRRFSLDGIVNFFENVGELCKDRKFTQFYEAHVKLNMLLWGNKQQKKRMRRFYTHSDEVNKAVKSFLDRVGHSKDSKNAKLDFLDEANWKEITKIYCEELNPLMTKNYAMPTFNHSGAGTAGRESEDSSNQGNVIQKERMGRKFREGIVMKAYKRGEDVPMGVEDIEAMDIVYDSLAGRLAIKAETFTESMTMPITRLGKRPLTERDNLRHTVFGFGDKGEVELRKRRYSIDIPIDVKESPRGFPSVKVGMCDVSISMQQDLLGGENIGNTNIIPWGDNSKYHWGVLAQKAIWKYLIANHLMAHTSEVSSVLFGERTEVVKGLSKINKRLLNPSFQSDTLLNWDTVKVFFEGYGNLLYTISDGYWGNWGELSEKFIGMIKERDHTYVHLQMGPKNGMTGDLEKAGLRVVYGKDGQGIVQDVIDLTDRIFRGGRS